MLFYKIFNKKILYFLIALSIFISPVNAEEDANAILEKLKQDVKTLEKAVYSDSENLSNTSSILSNNDEDENKGDTRSDAKGAEPEALEIGEIGERKFAFVGLERMAGIMIFDITNPYNTQFVDYFINRGTSEGADITGDLAPEGMKFVSAQDSVTGEALLIVGNEISGTVAVWQISEK